MNLHNIYLFLFLLSKAALFQKMRWNHGSGVINLKKKLEKYDILFWNYNNA